MTVLVTGATGHVGRFIVECLIDSGTPVVAAARTPPPAGLFSAPVPFRPMTLDPNTIGPDLFDGITAVVHAAFSHVRGRYRGGEGDDPAGFLRANREASVALFDAAKAAGAQRAVFLSSRAVYGRQAAGAALVETMPCRPDTLYGEAKLAVEDALAARACRRFAAVSLRVTGVYGPAGPGRDHKWATLFDDFLAGRPLAPRAGTEVHGGDVAEAVRLMIRAEPADITGRVFNVSDLLLDRHDLLAMVGRATGCHHKAPPPADCTAYNIMDTTRLARLGWRPGGLALLERTVYEMVGDRRRAEGPADRT